VPSFKRKIGIGCCCCCIDIDHTPFVLVPRDDLPRVI
jgi:hypothetical protein